MKKYITLEQYNVLGWEQKLKIQNIFSIKPSAQREMVNNKVKFDGIISIDLEVIDIGNMIEQLGDNWSEGIKDWGIDNLCDQLWERILVMIEMKEDTPISEDKEEIKDEIKEESKEEKKPKKTPFNEKD